MATGADASVEGEEVINEGHSVKAESRRPSEGTSLRGEELRDIPRGVAWVTERRIQ